MPSRPGQHGTPLPPETLIENISVHTKPEWVGYVKHPNGSERGQGLATTRRALRGGGSGRLHGQSANSKAATERITPKCFQPKIWGRLVCLLSGWVGFLLCCCSLPSKEGPCYKGTCGGGCHTAGRPSILLSWHAVLLLVAGFCATTSANCHREAAPIHKHTHTHTEKELHVLQWG